VNALTRSELRELTLRARGDTRTAWPSDTPTAIAELTRRGLLDHAGLVTAQGDAVLSCSREGGGA